MAVRIDVKKQIMCIAQRSSSTGTDTLPLNVNDVVSPTVRNRNPLNLEKMRIGYKPQGFLGDKGTRRYWNALSLNISPNPVHTTAKVSHWTGRVICSASTKEWAIQKFLYNNADLAAVKIVGKVLGTYFVNCNLMMKS